MGRPSYSVGPLMKAGFMYIYNRKSQSRFREELITSRSRERNSNYPGRILGGLLGRVGSDRSYVWENGGVGQLRNDNSRRTRLSEIVRLGEKSLSDPGEICGL